MKFFSWNVNGFRSVLKQGFMDWLEQTDPDVLNIQEIRAEWEQLDLGVRRELESAYEVCWFPAVSKKGYAGSATLSRRGLGFRHTPGLGLEAYDREGRIIVSERENLAFVAGYFPNASAGLSRLPFKRQFAQDLAAALRARHGRGQRIILTGDFNVAPEDIDLARPRDNHMSPGFTDEERADFRLYLEADMVDVLRERHPGVPGLYTWWSARGGARERNVGWRIDHFLVSRPMVEQVGDVAIHPEVRGSDHCPISLELLPA